MKSIRSLLLVAMATVSMAAIADDTPSLESHWMAMLKTPGYQAFYGMPAAISENPYVGTLWNRIDFAQVQASPNGNYQTEILLMRFDCSARKAAVARSIKYSDKKAVISDVTTSDGQLKYFDVNGKAPQGPKTLPSSRSA